MKREYCVLNGRYVETAEARISATDRGFLYGEGLFETWRCYRGRAFALDAHLRRMTRSAKTLGIPFDNAEPWETRSRRLVERNGLVESGALVRLTITRGSGPIDLLATSSRRPTRLMVTRGIDPSLPEKRRSGVGVCFVGTGRGGPGGLGSIKSVNYLAAVLGKAEAKKRGAFEALYTTVDGKVLEGTTSNVFARFGSTLVTTPIGDGVLPGVTRALVLRLAARLASVEQRTISRTELARADELFLTASSIEVLPVVRVGARRVGDGKPGELTRTLQPRYRRAVARSLGVSVDELGD